jgi:hypothetical protein
MKYKGFQKITENNVSRDGLFELGTLNAFIELLIAKVSKKANYSAPQPPKGGAIVR